MPGLLMAALAPAQTQRFVAVWTVALRDVTVRGRSQDAAEVSPCQARAVGRAHMAVVPPPLSALTWRSEALGTATRPSRLLQAVLDVPGPGVMCWGAAEPPRAELGVLCWSCCSHW